MSDRDTHGRTGQGSHASRLAGASSEAIRRQDTAREIVARIEGDLNEIERKSPIDPRNSAYRSFKAALLAVKEVAANGNRVDPAIFTDLNGAARQLEDRVGESPSHKDAPLLQLITNLADKITDRGLVELTKPDSASMQAERKL